MLLDSPVAEKIDSPDELEDWIDTVRILSEARRVANPPLEFFIQQIKDQLDPGGIHATDEAIRQLAERLQRKWRGQ